MPLENVFSAKQNKNLYLHKKQQILIVYLQAAEKISAQALKPKRTMGPFPLWTSLMGKVKSVTNLNASNKQHLSYLKKIDWIILFNSRNWLWLGTNYGLNLGFSSLMKVAIRLHSEPDANRALWKVDIKNLQQNYRVRVTCRAVMLLLQYIETLRFIIDIHVFEHCSTQYLGIAENGRYFLIKHVKR